MNSSPAFVRLTPRDKHPLSNPNNILPVWRDNFRAPGASDFPHGGRNFVLISRAMQQIGRAMFSDDWTGVEPAVYPPERDRPPSAEPDPATPAEWAAAAILRRHPERTFELVPFVPGPSTVHGARNASRDSIPSPPRARLMPHLTGADVTLAMRIVREEHYEDVLAAAPYLMRRDAVRDAITSRCIAETLKTYFIHPDDCEVREIPHLTWNTVHAHDRLKFCRVSCDKLLRPVREEENHERLAWIFLDAAEVNRLCAELRPGPTERQCQERDDGRKSATMLLSSPKRAREAVRINGGKFDSGLELAKAIIKLANDEAPGTFTAQPKTLRKSLMNKAWRAEVLTPAALGHASKVREGKAGKTAA